MQNTFQLPPTKDDTITRMQQIELKLTELKAILAVKVPDVEYQRVLQERYWLMKEKNELVAHLKDLKGGRRIVETGDPVEFDDEQALWLLHLYKLVENHLAVLRNLTPEEESVYLQVRRWIKTNFPTEVTEEVDIE